MSKRKGSDAIGPLMVDVAGLELTAEDREVLGDPRVGGLILFTRNYQDLRQLRALCDALRALKRPRLLLAVDHEGGRVQRFRTGFTRVPPMRTLGHLYAENPRFALEQARHWGRTIGRELGSFGIDLCFAPVLDRDAAQSEVIGDRAFAAEPAAIVALAGAFGRGLAAAGMAATGKHFPGHGAVAADSHHELPIDRRPFEEIAGTDLVPFAELARERIPSLMLAHVRYSAVDPTPASLSKHWIGTVLRKQLRYDGAVFCDDLSMGGAAAAGTMTDRARLALAAGCDMLLVCNNRPAVHELLGTLKAGSRAAATRRLRRLYGRKK